MTNKQAVKLLTKLRACDEATEWIGSRAPSTAWAECQRGDWMLWIAGRAEVDRKLLVRTACACAMTALVYVKKGEDRPRIAIETAEAWCEGKATMEQVRTASAAAAYAAASADAAYAASAAAASAAASADAAAAASAAASADAAASAASAAAASADSAAASASASASAAITKARKQSADIVRDLIPWSTVEAALAAKPGKEEGE